MSKENKLINKVIDLGLAYHIEESNIYIEYLCNQIKFYESQIKEINNRKIFKFQKKKLKDHKEQLEEYNNKIMKLCTKLEEEINLVVELKENNK